MRVATSLLNQRLCVLMGVSNQTGIGLLAQMGERSLCMREVRGSIPRRSISYCLPHTHDKINGMSDKRVMSSPGLEPGTSCV